MHNIVVIELVEGDRRVPHLPHLYVVRTRRIPDAVLRSVNEGNGPKWVGACAGTLRADLVSNYKPTRKFTVAEARVKNLKLYLSRQGFAINGDAKSWRVYVLDIDADVAPAIKNRGKLGKVVYVGATSSPVSVRLAQHRGMPSTRGRFIGSRKTKGRNPTLNVALTPDLVLYTVADAKKFESQCARKLKKIGYRVFGDGLTTDQQHTAPR